MTAEEKLRLKCLKLAIKANYAHGGTTWVIETAKQFEQHVKHGKPS